MTHYEVYQYNEIGYQKLFSFQSWRIAILNYIDELDKENITKFQAHLETDEAFVLLEGAATLFYLDQDEVKPIHLEKNKVYNMKKGVYHSHVLSKTCKILIIEEENTSDDNSPFHVLTEKQKAAVIRLTGENHGII